MTKNINGTHELFFPQHMHARLQNVWVYVKEIYAYHLFVYFFTIYVQDIRLSVGFPMRQGFLLFSGYARRNPCASCIVQLHWSRVALTRTPPGWGAHRSRWRWDNVRLCCCSPSSSTNGPSVDFVQGKRSNSKRTEEGASSECHVCTDPEPSEVCRPHPGSSYRHKPFVKLILKHLKQPVNNVSWQGRFKNVSSSLVTQSKRNKHGLWPLKPQRRWMFQNKDNNSKDVQQNVV